MPHLTVTQSGICFNFEQIVGLQEEFKEKAYEVADNMINSGYFIGGEKLKELIDKKPSIHKKLIKVEKLGGYKNISPKMLSSMMKVCKKYGETLPIQNDKLSIESEQNIDTILKVAKIFNVPVDIVTR